MVKKGITAPQEIDSTSTDETLPILKKSRKSSPIPAPELESEIIEPTEGTISLGDDEPIEASTEITSTKPRKQKRQSRWTWFGILGMLLIAAIGIGIGYGSALNERNQAEKSQKLEAAVVQFEQALVDQKEGRLLTARKRFEYVLSIYPDYPGVGEKLVEVGLLLGVDQGGSTLPTPQVINPTSATPSNPGANSQTLNALNRQAKNYLKAQDWNNLYITAVKMRDIYPKYDVTRVDGYYYMALRNLGMSKILAGNLEVGSYYFSLAEQIGPIDVEAQNLNNWAHLYLTAGSWWGISWLNAIEKFAELYQIAPNLLDSSNMSVKMRYAGSYEGYGDFLQLTYKWCDAVPQFLAAANILPSDRLAEKIVKGEKLCANPPPMPTPTYDPNAPTPTPTKKPKKN